jgi:hypothetical protein
LFGACPANQRDRAFLLGDGCRLPGDQLSDYGSFPDTAQDWARLDAALAGAGIAQDTLLTVPGFHLTDKGALTINGNPGLMVGIRDVEGYLVGVQIRKRAGGYYYLSSSKYGGSSPGSPAHVVRGASNHMIVIAESARKAHAAAVQLGMTAIGIPGHATYASVLEPLRTFQQQGALAVAIALDEDSNPETIAKVEVSRQALIRECLALGYAVRLYRWDHSLGKGIDDLLLAGHQPTMEIVPSAPLDHGDDPDGTGDGGDGNRPLSQGEKAKFYDTYHNILWNHDRDANAPSMKPVQKLALLTAIDMTHTLPATPTHGFRKTVPTNLKRMGALIGCSAATAGKTVTSLAAAQLLRREEQTVQAADGSAHKVVCLAAGRRLGFNEVLPEPEHLHADKERKKAKRCAACGEETVISKIVHTCTSCGTVEEEPLNGEEAESAPTHTSPFQRKRPGKTAEWQIAAEEAPEADTPADTPYPRNPAIDHNRIISLSSRTPTPLPTDSVGRVSQSPPSAFAHTNGGGVGSYPWANGGAP